MDPEKEQHEIEQDDAMIYPEEDVLDEPSYWEVDDFEDIIDHYSDASGGRLV